MFRITTNPLVVFNGAFRGLPADGSNRRSADQVPIHYEPCIDEDYEFGALAAFAFPGTEDNPRPIPCIITGDKIVPVIEFSTSKFELGALFYDEYGPYVKFEFSLAMVELARIGLVKISKEYVDYIVGIGYVTREQADKVLLHGDEREEILKKWEVIISNE